MKYFLFAITFLFIANRGVIYAFVEGLFNKKVKRRTHDITDKRILTLIQKKTGLTLSKILLFDTDKVWGMMAGFPPKPYMIITTDALKRFDKDEMEWIYLHEAGHYVLWHNLKMALLQIFFLIPSFVILSRVSNFSSGLFFAILLSISFSVVYFQLARLFEYEASNFALKRISNPEGIITLAEKAKKWWRQRGVAEKSLFHKLFNTWIYDIYVNLAKNAQEEIHRRSGKSSTTSAGIL